MEHLFHTVLVKCLKATKEETHAIQVIFIANWKNAIYILSQPCEVKEPI